MPLPQPRRQTAVTHYCSRPSFSEQPLYCSSKLSKKEVKDQDPNSFKKTWADCFVAPPSQETADGGDTQECDPTEPTSPIVAEGGVAEGGMAARVRLLDRVPSDEATDEEPYDEDVVLISAAEPPCTTPVAVVGLSLLVAVLGVALWLITTRTKPLLLAIYLILVLSTAVLGFFLQEYGLCVRWIVGVICVSMLAAFKTFVVMLGYRDSPLWAKICVYSTTGTMH